MMLSCSQDWKVTCDKNRKAGLAGSAGGTIFPAGNLPYCVVCPWQVLSQPLLFHCWHVHSHDPSSGCDTCHGDLQCSEEELISQTDVRAGAPSQDLDYDFLKLKKMQQISD
jgi:hypothetical protein